MEEVEDIIPDNVPDTIPEEFPEEVEEMAAEPPRTALNEQQSRAKVACQMDQERQNMEQILEASLQ